MKSLEKEISKYLRERNWHQLRPGDLAKSISIEAGELLELFQWQNPTAKEVKKDKEKMVEIKKELADVMIYCIDLSILFGFDTKKIIREKLDVVRKKFPAKVMKNEYKKHGPGNQAYLKIKKEHRQKGM